MDQTGAVLGPLGIAFVLARRAGYHIAFALLAVPAAIAFVTLLIARRLYPRPQDLEVQRPATLETTGAPGAFWLYLVAGALVAAGTVDFPLAAYHFAHGAIVPVARVPLFYALAMGAAAVTAPIVGRIYDRLGLIVVAGASIVPAAAAPLLFLGGAGAAALGVVVWGVGMAVQEATVRAALGDMVPADRRASAYGTFDAVFGIAWFAGSALMGVLYDRAPAALVIFSVATQLLAVALLALAAARRHSRVG
jgi:predicted MFS family arabinose efflux permease